MKTDKRFFRAYLIFVAVLLILAVAILFGVKAFLSKYQSRVEAEKTDYVWQHSQDAFEAFISNAGIDYWVDLWFKDNPDSFDSRTDVEQILGQVFSGNYEYRRAEAYTDDNPVYIVQNTDTVLAEVSLAMSGDGSWQIDDAKMRYEGSKEASICAPKGCVVTCNGIELDESYCTDNNTTFFLSQYQSDLKNSYSPVTWTVSNQLTDPQLVVIPPDNMNLSEDDDGNPILTLSAENGEKFLSQAEQFFDQYNKYGLYGYFDVDTNMKDTMSLCKKDSQVYVLISEAYEGMRLAPCHSVYETKKTIENPIMWAENAVSVDITFDTETTYMGTEKDYFAGEFRILMIDFGNGFEICGLSQRK